MEVHEPFPVYQARQMALKCAVPTLPSHALGFLSLDQGCLQTTSMNKDQMSAIQLSSAYAVVTEMLAVSKSGQTFLVKECPHFKICWQVFQWSIRNGGTYAAWIIVPKMLIELMIFKHRGRRFY